MTVKNEIVVRGEVLVVFNLKFGKNKKKSFLN